MPKLKVISGGQTGADRTALTIARELGIETGGWVPNGWQTDDGPDPSLAALGLRECGFVGYRVRTRWNVRDADATVLFGDTTSPGCTLTQRVCVELTKPWIENPPAETLYRWLLQQHPQVLNVAGNRQRTHPEIVAIVRNALHPALAQYLAALERPSPVASTPAQEREETAAAIASVDEHANEAWKAYVDDVAWDVFKRVQFPTTEAIWEEIQTRGDAPPVHDPRAIGPRMRTYQTRGWIKKAGSSNAERMRHNAIVNVWQSVIYEGAGHDG